MILKKQLYHIHSLIGLVLGIFLFLISLSGSILVFRPELEKQFFREEILTDAQGKKASLNQVSKAIDQKFPSYLIGRLYTIDQENELHQALLVSRKDINEHLHITVNPYTLEVKTRSNNWLQFLTDLHHHLLLPHYTGNVILFVFSILYLVLSITGVLIRKDFFKNFFRFNTRKTFLKNLREVHVLLGYWSILFHLIMITTSVVITFATVLYGPMGEDFLAKISTKPVNYDRIEQFVQEKYQLPIKHIQLAPEAYAVNLYANQERQDEFYQTIKLQLNLQYELISEKGLDREPLVWQGLNACTTFHFGRFGGIFIKILYVLFGVALSCISLTGTVMYFTRKQSSIKLEGRIQKVSFGTLLKKGIVLSFWLITISCVLGIILGVFGNQLFRSTIYLGVHMSFLFILLWILLCLFFPFKLLMNQLMRKRMYVYRTILIIGMGAFIPALIFSILVSFL